MACVRATHLISSSSRRLCAPSARGCSVGSENGWVPAATISTPAPRAISATRRRRAGSSRARSETVSKTGETISTHDRESSEVTRAAPSPASTTAPTAGARGRGAGAPHWEPSSTPAGDSDPPATKILLPLLASLLVAVLLVTGACGASAARDERRAQATPTTTAESTGRPPTGGADTSSPNRKPDLTGTITEVERGKPGAGSAGRILVEEDPNVEFSAGPNTEAWEKLFFEITDKTRIFVRRGGNGGEVVAATAADLAKGQMVDAWHGNHDVAES